MKELNKFQDSLEIDETTTLVDLGDRFVIRQNQHRIGGAFDEVHLTPEKALRLCDTLLGRMRT